MKHRSAIYLGAGAVVLLVLAPFALLRDSMVVPISPPESIAPGEVLSPVNLTPDERIVIDYRITRGTDSDHWIFQLTAAHERRLAIIDAGDGWGGDRLNTGMPKAIGALTLSDTECRGLQAFFEYFRKSDHQVTSTARTDLKLEYFRGLKKIGEEAFMVNDMVEHRIEPDDDDTSDGNASIKIVSLKQLAVRARIEADRE